VWVDRLGSLFGLAAQGPWGRLRGGGCRLSWPRKAGALVAQAARVREHAGLQHRRQAGHAGGAHCVEQMASCVRQLAGGPHLSLKDIGSVV
jgi:hypothetical protein